MSQLFSEVEEVRFDLDVPYEGLDLELTRELFRLGTIWSAKNATLRAERLRQEAAGPDCLA
jgi:hypothetical protein